LWSYGVPVEIALKVSALEAALVGQAHSVRL